MTSKQSAQGLVAELWTNTYVRHKAFALWRAHLEWLEGLGFKRAFEVSDQVQPIPPSGHEVVDLLAEFVLETGYVNAHLGLTSSDIVDNVRLIQLQQSLHVLRHRLNEVVSHVLGSVSLEAQTTGYTHLVPAAPIAWSFRANAWTAPLRWLAQTQPTMSAKRFGGPVGDSASLRALLRSCDLSCAVFREFPWHDFDLDIPVNSYPLQSSDHHDELQAVNWCCAVAGQLHKVASDLRHLVSLGHVSLLSPVLAGSSSMPHKVNPFKWEKVCGICRSVEVAHQEVWSVLAHNTLERTLDTSWQLKHALERCLTSLALAMDELLAVEFCVSRCDAELTARVKNLTSSDARLTEAVIAGKSRWSAYWDEIQARKNTEE